MKSDNDMYCIHCDKYNHYTNDCQSTCGLNTPEDRELFRLCQAANSAKKFSPAVLTILARAIQHPVVMEIMADCADCIDTENEAQHDPEAVGVPYSGVEWELAAFTLRADAEAERKSDAEIWPVLKYPTSNAEGWHAPGLGEVHSEDHRKMIYCEAENAAGEMVISDSLAEIVCEHLKGMS